ncbi:hypothetical protein EDD22DRAFT_27672 [Suillus occidentalis]|nr:hypothetical protein EDD22DRAFT_27672 [Suillus occidentalis]
MSSPPKMKKTSAVTPRKTMRGHTDNVYGVVHLPGGQRIITCSTDGSLRLWELESGAQIGITQLQLGIISISSLEARFRSSKVERWSCFVCSYAYVMTSHNFIRITFKTDKLSKKASVCATE